MGKHILLGFLLFFSQAAKAESTICYVPGAQGLRMSFISELREYFKDRPGVAIVPFDVGRRGDVQTRAARFLTLFEAQLKENPDFKCHLMAYSMGGVLTRYAFAKLKLVVNQKEYQWPDVIQSFSTFASPHGGTSVADLIGEFFPDLRGRGLESVSERSMALVNDPRNLDYWVFPAIPSYSYRTYIDNREQAYNVVYKMAHEYILKDSQMRGIDGRNDGLVPYRLQGFGQVLADFTAPHSFFTDRFEDFFPMGAHELLKMHYDCLTTGHSDLLNSFRQEEYFHPQAGFDTFCN
jgi:hypothetical protein